jgi:hypothetical protein
MGQVIGHAVFSNSLLPGSNPRNATVFLIPSPSHTLGTYQLLHGEELYCLPDIEIVVLHTSYLTIADPAATILDCVRGGEETGARKINTNSLRYILVTRLKITSLLTFSHGRERREGFENRGREFLPNSGISELPCDTERLITA